LSQPDYEIRYIELKTGYNDDGPAWIGKVKLSKTSNTVYFNDHAFKKYQGINSNFYDVETGESYWISGVKKNSEDRYWAGKGKVMIDKKITDDYLAVTGAKELNLHVFEVVEIEDSFPIERIRTLENLSR